jgi:uncharacterized protein YndB with AHSA1/START domain
MADSVTRDIFIAAPPARVWAALTEDWGTWFKVALDGPFRPGERVTGKMTYPGFEGSPFEMQVEAMEPPSRFAFRWPQWDMEKRQKVDVWTLVEFRLAGEAEGTRVTVTESRFGGWPGAEKALRQNTEGWEIQLGNLRAHVG